MGTELFLRFASVSRSPSDLDRPPVYGESRLLIERGVAALRREGVPRRRAGALRTCQSARLRSVSSGHLCRSTREAPPGLRDAPAGLCDERNRVTEECVRL